MSMPSLGPENPDPTIPDQEASLEQDRPQSPISTDEEHPPGEQDGGMSPEPAEEPVPVPSPSPWLHELAGGFSA